ncbi:DUF2460 domain-containing protein [Donghicola mangrovi]|uniref:DUF2460 domain-containing protein n=1 Tax=Donghicola mangrovi TaxID=2729614 RepID=A0A850PZW4_9RHOB|nr:DUF2460 domain-containing protein [Donghicola mangrovi]NVO22827.1 DUF2460 domain-containing protein [Donghicola mangrovi]
MDFHEVRFPADLSFGSAGGPERRTRIVTLANGYEERNTSWQHSRRRYDAGLGLRSLGDLEALIGFFEARRGPLYGFRWKDWSDYRSVMGQGELTPEDVEIAVADGATRQFALAKEYRSGSQTYLRPITKPVRATVRIAADGVEMHEGIDWSLEYGSGLITFVTPPEAGATITAGFEFDVPVRFDTERISISMASFNAGEVPDVPVVEVRV